MLALRGAPAEGGGPPAMPAALARDGKLYSRYFTPQGRIFQQQRGSRAPPGRGGRAGGGWLYVTPQPSTLEARLGGAAEPGFVSLLEGLLQVSFSAAPPPRGYGPPRGRPCD